jgi:branched-chain amino acid transport system ATP-binding protein
MLEVRNVSKMFGGIHALENVSITVERGKVWSMIGPNGAGKTTLFNLITGTLPVDRGTITFQDEDITHLKSYHICNKGIARTYQQKNLFPNLTVYENVRAGLLKDAIKESERKKTVLSLLEFLGLNQVQDVPVSGLSPLDSKLVELGRALATNPSLILLDELIGGLVPSETEKICELIQTLKDTGYTVFQIGHEIGPIMKTSDWIFVLDKGMKLAEGSPADIKKNKDVHDVYLE